MSHSGSRMPALAVRDLKTIGHALELCLPAEPDDDVPIRFAALVRSLQVQDRRSITPNPPCALVVETDRDRRLLAEIALDDLALVVVGCETVDAALSILEARGCDVIAVFADCRTAGFVTGANLARTIAARWPRTRLIVSAPQADACGAIPPGATVMPKPWRGAILRREIETILRARTACGRPDGASRTGPPATGTVDPTHPEMSGPGIGGAGRA